MVWEDGGREAPSYPIVAAIAIVVHPSGLRQPGRAAPQ